MAPKNKNSTYSPANSKPRFVVDHTLSKYEHHPFFEKKANEAKAFLEKVGLPRMLDKKR